MRRNVAVLRVKDGFTLITTGLVSGTTEFTLISSEADLTKRLSEMSAQVRAQGDELEVTVEADEPDQAMRDAIDKAFLPTSS